MFNTKLLKKNIKIHKLLTKEFADNKFLDLTNPAIIKQKLLGQEIALLLADFKCETPLCENKSITIHHLINRRNQNITPINKYVSQRHYFFNLVILCIPHHNIIDKEKPSSPKMTITEERIKINKGKVWV